MTTPVKPQDYATAGNYPAGSDDWSGQPRTLLLTDTEKAAGATPDTPIGADIRNGLDQEYHQARSLLVYRAIREWVKEELPVTAGGKSCLFPFLVSCPLPNVFERAVIAIGYDANDSNHFVFMRSLGSGIFEDTVKTDGTEAGPNNAAGSKPGEFLIGNATNIVKGVSLGSSIGTTGFSGGDGAVIYYVTGSGNYILLDTSGATYYGTSLASLTGPVVTTVTDRVNGSLGVPAAEFADDGGSNVIWAGSCTVGGVSRFRISHSGDGGATWAAAYTAGASVNMLNVAWHAATSQFVGMTSAGEILVSANGSAWTNPTTSSTIVGAAGFSLRQGTFAVAGHCIAKVFTPNYYSGVAKAAGIAYSFDLGVTWRVQHVGDQDAFGFQFDLRSLISANGRFYATDESRVFRSGVVSYEGNDY